MLAIGRALLGNPRLLIMDEPSEGLAPAIVDMMVDVFKKLEEEGLAILLIEQKLDVATSLAERQLVMVGGEIALETTAAELERDTEMQRRYPRCRACGSRVRAARAAPRPRHGAPARRVRRRSDQADPDLVFVSTRDGDYAIYGMSASGGGEHRLTDDQSRPLDAAGASSSRSSLPGRRTAARSRSRASGAGASISTR